MKHSQTIGIIATLALVAICFLPWSYIASRQITITGFQAVGTHFGKPGLLTVILSGVMLVMFAVPAIWSKRTNVLIAALNLAWSFRNYLMISTCLMGECPEKKPALYAQVALSAVILLMTLLPRLDLKGK
ncbi:MAG: hypothetical protein HYU71_01760 [Bacteroidetes bacterium]|nr:hypothetical protein [Bacteroidota bacterium]